MPKASRRRERSGWTNASRGARGEVGRIELGKASFTVGAVLTLEPDRGVSFFNIAPRLLMRVDDLAATGLIQTGSRASYQLLAAGADAAGSLRSWAGRGSGAGQRIESLGNARPEVRAGLDRAHNSSASPPCSR